MLWWSLVRSHVSHDHNVSIDCGSLALSRSLMIITNHLKHHNDNDDHSHYTYTIIIIIL